MRFDIAQNNRQLRSLFQRFSGERKETTTVDAPPLADDGHTKSVCACTGMALRPR
jgi:hypothetical protein